MVNDMSRNLYRNIRSIYGIVLKNIEETRRRLDRRFTYYDNPLINEALEKWRGW